MFNAAVKAATISEYCLDELEVAFMISSDLASLHFSTVRTGGDSASNLLGKLEFPFDSRLGDNDPRLRLLRAIEVAASIEWGRLRAGAQVRPIHAPQPLDLSDLHLFPGSASERDRERGVEDHVRDAVRAAVSSAARASMR